MEINALGLKTAALEDSHAGLRRLKSEIGVAQCKPPAKQQLRFTNQSFGINFPHPG